ncbi:MAG: 8-amino-7-oxononanoate synthase [Betaproteobacteria bacterium]|nr:8-amino-7-oxononanoate synthase [Betaproteobacteria bacterium]PWB59538.1 MAG: 8-amino-7-oxononanoate synthase [Betaproteobacteria bacterium]
MPLDQIAALARGLEELDRVGLRRRRRVLDSPQGPVVREGGATLVNFASNDYLGLASHPRIVAAAHRALDEYGFGAGASPLVVGHSRPHQEAEEAFARFAGLPRAILFASGYAANLGILASLADRSAAIFADRLDHACLVDGAILSRAALHRYPHGDLGRLEAMLAASKPGLRIIATDAVFSMDGDVAPVPELLALAERHDAWLVLDDAHGIGVLGGGRGTLAHFGVRSPRIVYMATLGKALGGYGAFVAGEPGVVEWLLQRARPYVFSTALPPAAAAVATEALRVLEEDPAIVRRLHERIAGFRDGCASRGIATASPTAIQPVVVGEAARAVALAARLRERGQLVPAIRPPTVPEGTSRLRVSLSAAHTPAQVATLVAALAEALGDGAAR